MPCETVTECTERKSTIAFIGDCEVTAGVKGLSEVTMCEVTAGVKGLSEVTMCEVSAGVKVLSEVTMCHVSEVVEVNEGSEVSYDCVTEVTA